MLATLVNAPAVYVVAEPCDLRKSIDGLALAVASSLGTSPLSGSVFVFFNRGRDKVKLLWWGVLRTSAEGSAGDAVSKMREGPSVSPIRRRHQTTHCCGAQEAW